MTRFRTVFVDGREIHFIQGMGKKNHLRPSCGFTSFRRWRRIFFPSRRGADGIIRRIHFIPIIQIKDIGFITRLSDGGAG